MIGPAIQILLLSSWLGAARLEGAGPQEGGPPQGEERAATSEAELRARAKAAIDAGEPETARQLLGELVLRRRLAEARALLSNGRPREALGRLDEALEIAPSDPDVLVLRGESSLALGEREDAPGQLELALESFRAAGDGARALFGAARAARLLGRSEEALRLARSGMAVLDRTGERLDDLRPSPQRRLAQAAFDTYVRAKGEGADEARVRELSAMTEDALSRCLASEPDEPWVWVQLSNLYRWQGRGHDARQALERGLARAPRDPELLELLYQVSLEIGGPEAALEAFGRYLPRHSDVALGWWYSARAHFQRGVRDLEQQPWDEFTRAAKGFARCRELAPEHAQACLEYELLCRTGVAWCYFHAGDLQAARKSFLATAELRPDGARLRLEGELPSAVEGLAQVAAAYHDRGDLVSAASAYDQLLQLEPDSARWATLAGQQNRDAAIVLGHRAEDLRRAARGELRQPERLAELRREADVAESLAGTPRERELLEERAQALARLSRSLYQRSWDAYVRAVELDPGDLRAMNDAAQLQVEYLREDVDRAERLLLRSVELGRERLSGAPLGEDERWELENAWGDAHQSLGTLYLELRRDPRRALGWFERSVEIGPDPRPNVSSVLIPRCRRLLEQG